MKLNNEIKIGILVTAVSVALLGLTFKIGNFNFTKKGYLLTIQFHSIEGLDKNAPVKLNGFEVGSVRTIKIIYEPQTIMELSVWLDESAKLKEGADARIKVMGLLGEKYIELSAGNDSAPFLAPGSLIVGKEPMDFEKLIAKGDVIADNLKGISENINERLRVNSQSIDEIVANLNSATKNISSISQNVNERLTLNKQAIDEIIQNLHGTTENLIELSSDLKANPWKLMYKSKDKAQK